MTAQATGEVREISILNLENGAISERIGIVLRDIAANILDPNTKAKEKRQIKVVIDLIPNENRDMVTAKTTVTAKLSSYTAIESTLDIGGSSERPVMVEHKKQLGGQLDISGGEEALPNIIELPQRAAI